MGVRHIAFQVENVDAKLAEMGSDAHIALGPLDFSDFIPGWRTVWVTDPEGNIVLNTVPVTVAELETRLNAAKSAAPGKEVPIVVRGDRATQYQSIMDVMDILSRVGFSQVGLVAAPAK